MAPRSLIRFALPLLAVGSAAATPLVAARPPDGEPTPEGRAPTPAELVSAVEAAFPRESYAPGDTANLVIFNRGRAQVFAAGAFYLTRLIDLDPVISRLLENLWARFAPD